MSVDEIIKKHISGKGEPLINYGEFDGNFFPKTGSQWRRHYCKFTRPISFSEMDIKNMRSINIQSRIIRDLLDEVVFNFRDELYNFFSQKGFIMAQDITKSLLVTDIEFKCYIPLITPKQLQHLYDENNQYKKDIMEMKEIYKKYANSGDWELLIQYLDNFLGERP